MKQIGDGDRFINWYDISCGYILSEEFIEKHANKVNWYYISRCQKLSEEFIDKHIDKRDLYYIAQHQKLSIKFYRAHKELLSEFWWKYETIGNKRKWIKEDGRYEIDGDKIIAYKSARGDGRSIYDEKILYEVGKEYRAKVDYNIAEESSYGLSGWTKEKALWFLADSQIYHKFSGGKLFKIQLS